MQNLQIEYDKKIIKYNNRSISLDTAEGYEIVRKLWEYTNWSNKYSYSFTWLGRPIIQLPDDMIRIQELIFRVKPTLIIETGIAHGGSLVFYASLLKMMGEGRVIGIDIDIRESNKAAIEKHSMFSNITLLQGSSIDITTVEAVQKNIKENDIFIDKM